MVEIVFSSELFPGPENAQLHLELQKIINDPKNAADLTRIAEHLFQEGVLGVMSAYSMSAITLETFISGNTDGNAHNVCAALFQALERAKAYQANGKNTWLNAEDIADLDRISQMLALKAMQATPISADPDNPDDYRRDLRGIILDAADKSGLDISDAIVVAGRKTRREPLPEEELPNSEAHTLLVGSGYVQPMPAEEIAEYQLELKLETLFEREDTRAILETVAKKFYPDGHISKNVPHQSHVLGFLAVTQPTAEHRGHTISMAVLGALGDLHHKPEPAEGKIIFGEPVLDKGDIAPLTTVAKEICELAEKSPDNHLKRLILERSKSVEIQK